MLHYIKCIREIKYVATRFSRETERGENDLSCLSLSFTEYIKYENPNLP